MTPSRSRSWPISPVDMPGSTVMATSAPGLPGGLTWRWYHTTTAPTATNAGQQHGPQDAGATVGGGVTRRFPFPVRRRATTPSSQAWRSTAAATWSTDLPPVR